MRRYTLMAYVVFDAEYRRLAKQANQRMVRLEQAGYKSPAYKAVQAKLQTLGRTSKIAAGRRFAESGKGTRNEIVAMKKALKDFLSAKTSTQKGYKDYRQSVLKGAQKKLDYRGMGLTDDEFLQIFEDLPDKEEDRIYYAAVVVETVSAAKKKFKRTNTFDIDEIVKILQESKDYKTALKEIGIELSDISFSLGAF